MKRCTFLFFVMIFGFSCTEKLEPTPYDYTTIFTGQNNKTWELEFVEETLNGDIMDEFVIGCATDDEYVFYANSERLYEAVTKSRKCSDNEDDVFVTSWSFNNASATLTMLLPFFTTQGSVPLIVREVKSNKMELEYFFDEENTESYRFHFDAKDED